MKKYYLQLSTREYCLLLTTLGLCWSPSLTATSTSGGDNKLKDDCEPIQINECRDVGYDLTSFKEANMFGHTSQDAVLEDPTFQMLARMLRTSSHASCSIDFKLFVCGMFLPRCVNDERMIPCKDTCKRVKDRCWSWAKLYYNLDWPKPMECDENNYFEDSDSCMLSSGNPANDNPIMVMDIPGIPNITSSTAPVQIQFSNCQCTCTPPDPVPCSGSSP